MFKMDHPIDIPKNPKLFYDRYYFCLQNIGKVECHQTEKVEITNNIFPSYNHSSTIFKIPGMIPSIFDTWILKVKLFKLIEVSKE